MTDRPEREVEGLDLIEGTLRGLDKMLRTHPGPTLWITKASLEQVRDALRTLQSERDRLEAAALLREQDRKPTWDAIYALRNCLMLAARERRKGNAEAWDHIIRFCKEAGVEPQILRTPTDSPTNRSSGQGESLEAARVAPSSVVAGSADKIATPTELAWLRHMERCERCRGKDHCDEGLGLLWDAPESED